MGELSDFDIGQTVELQDGRIATVQFVGETHFALGDWLGLKLDDATGKNDGAVQGQRYFECPPGYGMFVRPAVAQVIDQPASKTNTSLNGSAEGTNTKPQTQSTGIGGPRRQSALDPVAGKRQSIYTGSPTPGPKIALGSRILRSPSKSPTKPQGPTTLPSTTVSRTATLASGPRSSTIGVKPRNSIAARSTAGPPSASIPSRTSRPSVARTLNKTGNPPERPSLSDSRGPAPLNRLTIPQNITKKPKSTSGNSQISRRGSQLLLSENHELETPSPMTDESQDHRTSSVLSPAGSLPPLAGRGITISATSIPSNGRTSPNNSQRVPQIGLATNREIEDLKTKLRMMEKKRVEDREKLKALETVQAERDKFEGIIQKLQAKYQPQQQEIADLKRQIKDAEAKAQVDENTQGENDTALEMATLDREMAEETAESLRTELDALRQAHEELTLEAEILREENVELGKEMSPEERTSQGWMQMERSNDRLREALMRLRDVSKEQEGELKQQVRELEKDLQELGNVRAQYETVKERLAQSDAAVEDLHQQLETALGAEEMIEELTEKNMSLTEKLDDLRATVEDLESLKELNDELEINHMETEKQLQDEIDHQGTLILEQTNKRSVQDETISDLEYTLSRFRGLVTNLQSDLEDMRASQQITEAEASDLTSRSRAMLDLNMRLQTSASKAQVKTIDVELRRLEAQESVEHLAIVQRFLPSNFDSERNSFHSLFRLKRIDFKADLVHNLIKEKGSRQVLPGHEDEVFASYDILDKLARLSTMCERLITHIQTCDLEAFSKFEGALYDLEPVERALTGWIDAIKKDELKEEQCATELQRSIALMTHLAEMHIGDGLRQHAEDIRARVLLMQSNLDNAAAAISSIKSMAQSKIPTHGDGEEEDDEESHDFSRKMDSLISQTRSTKVISNKAIHQVEELKSRSLTLDPSTLPIIEQSQKAISEFAYEVRSAGMSLFDLVNQEGRTSSFTYPEIAQAISSSDSTPLSSLISKLQTVATQIQNLYTLTNTLSHTIEFPDPSTIPPPWDLLAHKFRAETTTLATHELEVGRLKGELQEKNTALAMKNQVVEEMGVKVEVLEKRVGESGGRRERVRELEIALDGAKSKERELINKLGRLQQDLHTTEAEREALRKQVSQAGSSFEARDSSKIITGKYEVTSIRAQEEISRLKAEISTFQSTIRYLRLSAHQTSLPSSHSFLSTPLAPKVALSEKGHLAYEARDVLKSMLALITEVENPVVQLKPRAKQDRMKWRPLRESTRWQVGRQREEWEAWRDWSDDVGKRGRDLQREEDRKRKINENKGEVLAQVEFHVPMIGAEKTWAGREVRIVRPGDWEDVERELGVA